MNNGFVRIASAVPKLKVADCQYNASKIIELICEAESKEVGFIVFPELSITSYSCGDLFLQDALLKETYNQLGDIIAHTSKLDIISIVGMPLRMKNKLYSCGVVLYRGRILGVVPKSCIRNSKGYNEGRWFSSGSSMTSDISINILGQQVSFGKNLVFNAQTDNNSVAFSLELGSDLQMVLPPSSYHSMAGAHIIFNLSAIMEETGLYEYRQDLVRLQSNKCNVAYAYTSAGVNESTTDGVFGGYAVISENGTILEESKRFEIKSQIIYADIDIEKIISEKSKNNCFFDNNFMSEDLYKYIDFSYEPKQTNAAVKPERNLIRYIDPYPFIPSDKNVRDKRYLEIFDIQTWGLAMRMLHTGSKRGIIGVSGGLDSTLALLVTANAFDKLGLSRKDIIAITMPGFGTTDTTFNSSFQLIESVGASFRKIDIKQACLQHFNDIGHNAENLDTTYENVQARERTQILMDIANKERGLVIGTGDLSELALGWCTYNGDHMSMYGVNSGIPKTLIKSLLFWATENMDNNIVDRNTKDILRKIIDTPITPELLPPDSKGGIKQKTEDIVGPYELHDFFIYYAARYGAAPQKLLFLAQQAFKDKYSKMEIEKWLKVFYKRFFTQQFKRSCMPDGPKVGTISFSPRRGWVMPSDAQMSLWLKQLEH